MGGESDRSFMIYEILKNVLSACGGVQLRSQYNIAARFGKGPVDFAIERYGTPILVTEAKKQDIEQGFAQCGVQLDSVRYINRKRKLEGKVMNEPKKLYGIVTTGREWILLRYEDTKPEFSVLKQAPLVITTVNSMIVNALVKLKYCQRQPRVDPANTIRNCFHSY